MIRFLHQQFALCCKKSTSGPLVLIGKTLSWVLLSWILHSGSILQGQIVETFDRSGPFFTLWRDDCSAQLIKQQRPKPGVETIEVRYKNGSHIYLTMPIEPAAIVDEFVATLRIRCGESGVRLGIRIVYPRSTHPATSDPLTAIVFGTPALGGGGNSSSTVRDIRRGVDAEERILRARYGGTIDLSEPYIDALVLDVYRTPGTTKLEIDDLVVDGVLSPSSAVQSPENLPRRTTMPSVHEQLLEMQATVPRWIQYQGESLHYLESLGFNGVIVPRADDKLVTEQAKETRIAVIAAMPSLTPSIEHLESLEHVTAWMLGWELNDSAMQRTRLKVASLSQFPSVLKRPCIGEAMEMYGAFGRMADWLAVPTPHPTRVRSAKETWEILHSDARMMVGRSSPLTSIVTQMPSEWTTQKAVLQRAIGGDAIGLPDTDLLQMRMAVYRGLMQGTRGWVFRSSGSLDSGDPTNMTRADGYKAINNEIELFSPWIKSNQSPWSTVDTNSQEHRAAVLTTPNSQLIVVIAQGPMDQICMVSPKTQKLQLSIPVTGQTRHVFRLTHGQLEPLRAERRGDRLVVDLVEPNLIEQIVTVVDPKPIEYLRTELLQRSPQLMEARVDTAHQVLQLAQLALGYQRLQPQHEHWRTIQDAEAQHREALRDMQNSDVAGALKAADRTTILAQRVLRDSWDEAVAQFTSFQSSPLVSSPLSLPLHWELHRVLNNRTWQSLAIPGASLTSWETLQRFGWTMDQRLEDRIATTAAIDRSGPGGAPAIVVSSLPATNQPISSGYGGAAMRISTGRINAPIGSLVQIHGKVQIDSIPTESQSGLLISDSLGGDALGQLVSSFDNSTSPWRKFSLFRFVTSNDGFQVYFETRGHMSARISEIQAEYIMPVRTENQLSSR